MCNWIVKRPETAAAINEAISAGTCSNEAHVEAIAARHGDEVMWTGTLPESKPAVDAIDMTVSSILRELGMPAHVKGYRYVREAIIIAVNDTDMIHAVTTALYPSVAKRFNTTPSRVERAVRHSIELTWDRGDLDTLQKYFGYTISSMKGKPTNSEFIAMVSEHIREGGEKR